MHYTHLNNLYPIFEDFVSGYLKECPIAFENRGEAIITSFIDAICDKRLSKPLKTKAINSLRTLQKDEPAELDGFIVTTIGNINLLGGTEKKKEIIWNSLPIDLQTIWRNLDHQQIEV